MHSDDREEFRVELGKLCAAFNVPATKAREDAYFTGLAKMSLAQFRRCVEHAIGPDYGEDTLPTTGKIWRIYKGTAFVSPPTVKALPPDPDHLEYFANRLLWMHVSHRGGLGSIGRFVPAYGMVDCHASDELRRCLKFKREIVAEFCAWIRDGDESATPEAFLQWWLIGMQKISDVLPRTIKDIEHLAAAPEAKNPFPPVMARPLQQAQEFAA
jgi:hypothetical protein